MSIREAQANAEPTLKKRKIEDEPARNGLAFNHGSSENQGKTVIFEAKDISFQIPVRKKLNLEITRGHNASFDGFTIRARNAGTNTVEYEGASSNFGDYGDAWREHN